MNDMGEANFVLGVKITRDHSKKVLSLSQRTYIKKILKRFICITPNPLSFQWKKDALLA